MKLYLDMCTLKRPFDDQTQERIALETRAVLAIMDRIDRGVDSMAWSTALAIENNADPDSEARIEVANYALQAADFKPLTPQIQERTRNLTVNGLRPPDAMHLAFAEAAACDILITRDDRFVRRARKTGSLIRILTPLEYWREVSRD